MSLINNPTDYFPNLSHFFSVYLNEDMEEIYGDYDGAIEEFIADQKFAQTNRISLVVKEIDRLFTNQLSDVQLAKLVRNLGLRIDVDRHITLNGENEVKNWLRNIQEKLQKLT